MWLGKLIKLLPRKFKEKGFWVVLTIPLRAFLDLIGVAALLPLLILVLDTDKVANLDFFQDEYSVLYLVIAILLIIIIKSLLNIFLLNNQNGFLLSLYKFFSSNLFSKLYNRGLLYVKNSNTSEITYNINMMCYSFSLSFLSSVLKFTGEILFSLLLLAALCIYNPLASVFMLVAFLPIVYVYLRIVRIRLKEYGEMEVKAKREQHKVVLETFRGYAEMEVNKAFPYMHDRFENGLDTIFKFKKKTMLIQSIPQYFLEFGVAMVVCAMVLFSVNAQNADMRVFLGVFTVVMIRMLPVVHSLINNWAGIKSSEYTLQILDDLSDQSPNGPYAEGMQQHMKFENAIEVANLSFSYSTGKVINDLSFSIKKGERFGIKGRTGAGKSTLFNLLLGLFPPDKGYIKVDGVALDENNISQWHELVGYVPQDVFIADLTIAENIALGHNMENIDIEKVKRVIKQASIEDFVSSLPEGLNTFIGEGGSRISGGQRQRIGIARALYKDAEVLFFDEATSSLDSATEREINDSIRELSDKHKQLTIIIISHRQSSLEFCDKIINV